MHPPAGGPLNRAARRRKGRCNPVCPAGQRQGIIADPHHGHAVWTSRISAGFIQPGVERVTHPRRWTRAAQAQAIDGLQPHPLARRCLHCGNQGLHPARLTGLGAAQLHHWARVRRGTEIVIETDHAVDLGAGQVKRVRDHALRLAIDAAERGLDIVQDRQQRPFARCKRGDDLRQARVLRHACSRSACQRTCSARKLEMK